MFAASAPALVGVSGMHEVTCSACAGAWPGRADAPASTGNGARRGAGEAASGGATIAQKLEAEQAEAASSAARAAQAYDRRVQAGPAATPDSASG